MRGTCPIRTLNEQLYYARDVSLIHSNLLGLKIEMHSEIMNLGYRHYITIQKGYIDKRLHIY